MHVWIEDGVVLHDCGLHVTLTVPLANFLSALSSSHRFRRGESFSQSNYAYDRGLSTCLLLVSCYSCCHGNFIISYVKLLLTLKLSLSFIRSNFSPMMLKCCLCKNWCRWVRADKTCDRRLQIPTKFGTTLRPNVAKWSAQKLNFTVAVLHPAYPLVHNLVL